MSLFDTNPDQGDKIPSVDPNKNYWDELVGEGKRYADPVAAGRGLAEKDAHIARLERETAGLRQELSSRTRMEELVEKLAQVKETPSIPVTTPDEPASKSPGLTPEDIQRSVDAALAKRDADANRNIVKQKLQEAWGSDYATKLRAFANQLSVGEQWLDSVAAQNPNAFLTLVGISDVGGGNVKHREADVTPSGHTVAPPRSSATFTPTVHSNQKNWKYYENMRRSSDPAVRNNYWSREVQMELHKEAERQGDAFYN